MWLSLQGMEKLATQIEECLRERAFCLVFHPDLERSWPKEKMDGAERERQIEGFAQFRGWHVSVLPLESGTRAIFEAKRFRP